MNTQLIRAHNKSKKKSGLTIHNQGDANAYGYNGKNLLKGSALLASLMLSTGCDMLKKKESLEPRAETASKSGVTLCSINGESAITEGEYKNNLNQMLQAILISKALLQNRFLMN